MKVQLYGGFMDGQEYEMIIHSSEIRIPIPPRILGNHSILWDAAFFEIWNEEDFMPEPAINCAVYKEFARGKYKLVDSGY